MKKVLKTILFILVVVTLSYSGGIVNSYFNDFFNYKEYSTNILNTTNSHINPKISITHSRNQEEFFNNKENDNLMITSFLNNDIDITVSFINSFVKKERPQSIMKKTYSLDGAASDKWAYGYQGVAYLGGAGTFKFYRSGASTSEAQSLIDQMLVTLVGYGGAIGDNGKAAYLAAHNNTGPFGGLGNIGIGQEISFETNYGNFSYSVVGTDVCDVSNGQASCGQGDLISMVMNGKYDLIIQTCYPFNQWETTQIYVVYANLN